MSMRITYLKDHDGHKMYRDYFVERTLARRLCENGVALPYITYLEKKKAEEALEKKKADLVKNREDSETETAISKKAKKREKAKIKTDKNDKK